MDQDRGPQGKGPQGQSPQDQGQQDQGQRGLLSAIEERARAERESIIAEAHSAARGLAERAEQHRERMRAEALRRLERELRAEAQRALGEARMEDREARLRLKRRLLAEAYRRAREKLSRLAGADPDRYRAAFEALLLEAVAGSGAVDLVEVRSGDARDCAAHLKRMGLDMKTREIGSEPLTLVVCSGDGANRSDNGLWSRLARMESREAEVARILFGPGDANP